MPNVPTQEKAVPFEKVLQDELEEIRKARIARRVYEIIPNDAEVESNARSGKLLGLALSGGGIRSATFNLGVLQGLAKYRLLPQIDYLSTVSGGGYIGAWFISLLKKNRSPNPVEAIQKTLSPAHGRHPEAEDQEPIQFLRQYSDYLTPRFAFYSADVWTAVATWSRNFLLNLLLLISTIGALLLVPRLLGLLFAFKWRFSGVLDAFASVLFFLVATAMLCLNLRQPGGSRRSTQINVQCRIVVPLFLGVVFLSRWLRFSPEFFHGPSFWSSIWLPWLFFAVVFSLIAHSSRMFECFLSEHPNLFPKLSEFERWWITRAFGGLLLVLAFLVPSFVTALMLWGFAGWVKDWTDWTDPQRPWALIAWGPPALALLLSLGVAVLVGIFGLDVDAQRREWLSRLRAWTTIYSAAWIIVFGGAIYGPLLVLQLLNWAPWTAKGLSFGWIVTTVAGVLSGRSALTGDKTSANSRSRAADLIARVAPFVFMAGFILLLASAINWVLTLEFVPQTLQQTTAQRFNVHVTQAPPNLNIDIHNGKAESSHPELLQRQNDYFRLLSCPINHFAGCPQNEYFTSTPRNLFLTLIAVALLLGFRLDINVFSLHEFYKNRLVRCYLGAVRFRDRKPDPFTGFDGNDDYKLSDFQCRHKYYGPYPIINTTMNVSTGEKLAWQERKSAPFIFTPLYSGFNSEKGNERMRLGEEEAAGFAYRHTDHYCYPRGVHLGTAIAVSGAAASPNQGYHTSTAVAFLMTVFDVRLGWWVGNPNHDKTYTRSSPAFNLAILSSELFGLSSSSAPYVNLSDGGHFDNMGLYELVRRQCRYIIVSDAEQDGDLAFGSFTQAIRNCRTDFGVEIKIALDRIRRKDKLSSAHCVVGTIEYPYPEGSPMPKPGYLLYLKSSLTGDEAADVTGYQTAHPEFPHQSTGNQWFTESQFEAYRKLGQHVVETALGSVRSTPLETKGSFEKERFFKELQDLWYPPSERVDRLSAKHAERFTDLTLDLGDKDKLEFLDSQIFVGWPRPVTDTAPWERSAKHRCSALIEFMESVYSELNLESPLEKEHPHNRGWLRIFEHWVLQPLFEETWESTCGMYSERFQQFYADRVKAAQQPKI